MQKTVKDKNVLFASVQQDLGYEEEQSVLLLEKYSTVQAALTTRGTLVNETMNY